MPAPRDPVTQKALAIVQGDAIIRPSKIPSLLQFPLVVTLSFVLSSLLYSFTSNFTSGELASISRRLDRWWEVAAVVTFRASELGVGWYGNYDSYDLVSLIVLSRGPPLYLLATFYEIKPITAVSCLIIDSLTTYIPFQLLRPLSLAHSASSFSKSLVAPNKAIITSTSIQTYTTVLAGSIYAVTLYSAYNTFLPVYLVTYFADIPTIAAAHSGTYFNLLPLATLLGLAAKTFLFTPAAATVPSALDAKLARFSPATATLQETFLYNIWGFSTRAKVLIKRTATAMLISGANTFVQTFVTTEGVEATGAIAYASVWVVAAGITGAAMGMVLADI